MKKIKILSFASLPLAMALLAGCGHQHTFSEEWNHDANKHWHDATCEHKDQVSEEGDHVYGDDNICDVCGYDKGEEPGPGPGPGPGPQPEIDHTVTAEEWLAFWDTSKPFYIADNYKATMVMTADGQSGSQTSVMTVDGNKAKFEGLIDGVAAQLDYCEFISKGNYKHYEYDKTAEKWYYEVGSNNPADDFAMQLQPFFTMTGFTYDEASKSYKKESSGTYSNLVIQFGAKKVTSYSFNFLMPVGPGVTMPVKMEGTFDYNGQVVTLPEPAEPAHVHNYNQLKYDEYSHWNACECGEREPYSGGAHFDADWDCKCDVCEYAMPVEVEPGYWMLIKDGGGYCSLEENPDKAGEFMTDMYFEENAQFSLFDVTDSAYNRFSELTLSDDEKTSATGVTISEGVVTIHEAGPYMFYLDPTYNEGKGILYVARNEGPAPAETTIGYVLNDNDPVYNEAGSLEIKGLHMGVGDHIKFFNVVDGGNADLTSLSIDGANTYGFGINEGLLTAIAEGDYDFTISLEFENDKVTIKGSNIACSYVGNVYLGGVEFETGNFRFDEVNLSSGYIQYKISNETLPKEAPAGYVTLKINDGKDDLAVTLEEAGAHKYFELIDEGKTLSYNGGNGFDKTFDFYLKENIADGALTLYIQDKASAFQMLVGSQIVFLETNPTPMEGFTEYFATNVSVNEGDVIRFVDNTQYPQVTFDITTIDSASVEDFSIVDGSIKCSASGSYDFYLKLQYGTDQVYIGAAA